MNRKRVQAQRLFRKFFVSLFQDESGQGLLEYILILSACVIGATQLVKQIIRSLDKGILRLGGALERDLKVGRAPLSVWEN